MTSISTTSTSASGASPDPNAMNRPPKSYQDYLQDVVGEESQDLEEDDELQQLNHTPRDPLTRSSSRRHRMANRTTPLSVGVSASMHSDMVSPQLTEARSFVNGLLSPFSPLLKQPSNNEMLEYVSLKPCRKLSIVVRVLPCEESEQRCLFPHVRQKQHFLHKPKSPHDMVVVKPSAFGKLIPSQVTMETARLVAQVAHISSEDWARLYEFHHVMWPEEASSTSSSSSPLSIQDKDRRFTTMDSLSRAVVQDALVEKVSSLLISMGPAPTCIGSDLFQSSEYQLSKIFKLCQALLEPQAIATMSLVEIKEEKDSFRDLFNPSCKQQIAIRHVDMKGAILQGLKQIPLDQLKDNWPKQMRRQGRQQTLVATISLWDNAISHQMNKAPDAQITCVELTRSAVDARKQTQQQYHSRSTVSLGLALRQLLLHAPQGTDPAISYRESTITKVLQRPLESSKIVLLASVSQLSKDYEITLATLNFLRGLIVKPGQTASSPFPKSINKTKDQSEEEDDQERHMADHLQEYATDETILEQITSDPRQRLARIMKPSPSKQPQPETDSVALQGEKDDEDYTPVDYMQGLDMDVDDEDAWKSPLQSREDIREPPLSVTVSHAEPEHGQGKEIWSMEELIDNDGDGVNEPVLIQTASQSMETNDWEEKQEEVFEDDEDEAQTIGPQVEVVDPDSDDDYTIEIPSARDDAMVQDLEQHFADLVEQDRLLDHDDGNGEEQGAINHDLDHWSTVDEPENDDARSLSMGEQVPETEADKPQNEMGEKKGITLDVSPQDSFESESQLQSSQDATNNFQDDWSFEGRLGEEPSENHIQADLENEELDDEIFDTCDHGEVHIRQALSSNQGPNHAEVPEAVSGLSSSVDLESSKADISKMLDLYHDIDHEIPREPSQEIVFTTEDEVDGDHDSLEAIEEPKMWSEWEAEVGTSTLDETKREESTTFDIHSASTLEYGEASPHEMSVDDSLVSAASKKSFNFPLESASPVKAAPNIEEMPRQQALSVPTHSNPAILQDTESRQRSAFKSYLPSPTVRYSNHSSKGTSSRKRRNSTRDNYMGEIEVLEDAVLQIQSMQSGLWRSSSESLAKLKDSLSSQRHEMTLLANERELLSNTVAGLKDLIESNSREHDSRMARYEEEVHHLQSRLQRTIAEKDTLEKGFSSSEAAGEAMSEKLRELESTLEITRRDLLHRTELYQATQVALDALQDETKKIKGESSDAKREKEITERKCSRLEESLSFLKHDYAKVVEESKAKGTDLRNMNNKFIEREKRLKELEEKTSQMQSEREREAMELERLKRSQESMLSSLEEAKRQQEVTEESNLIDKSRICELENLLDEAGKVKSDLVAENGNLAAENQKLDLKLASSESEATAKEAYISRMKERCHQLEFKLNESNSDRILWEEQRQKQRREIGNLQDENRALKTQNNASDTKIKKLEERLIFEGENKAEADRLREKYMHAESEKKELETLLTRYKTDRLDGSKQKSKEIATYVSRVGELEDEIQTMRQRELESAALKDSEILNLKEEVASLSSKLESAHSNAFTLQLQVETSEERLTAMNDQLERYRAETKRARDELQELQSERQELAVNSSRSVGTLKERITELENDLTRLIEERDRLSERMKLENTLAAKNIAAMKEKVDKYRADMNRSQEELRQVEDDRQKLRMSSDRNATILNDTIAELESDLARVLDEKERTIKRLQEEMIASEENLDAMRERAEKFRNEMLRSQETLQHIQEERQELVMYSDRSNDILNHRVEELENDLKRASEEREQVVRHMKEEISLSEENLSAAKASAERYRVEMVRAQDELHQVQEERQKMIIFSERHAKSLNERVAELESELSRISEERDRSTKCMKEEITLSEKTKKQAETYRQELLRAQEELRQIQEESQQLVVYSDRNSHNLNLRVSGLEKELSVLSEERDRLSKRIRDGISSNQALSKELEAARDELATSKRQLRQLRDELDESESHKQQQDLELTRLKKSMQKLRSNTHEKFNILDAEQRGIADAMRTLRNENVKLLSKLSKATRERDACIGSLQAGREKLSRLVGFDLVGEIINGQVSSRLHLSNNDATCFIEDGQRGPSELFLTTEQGVHQPSTRAEEIATYLALCAKVSLQGTQDENTILRSRVFTLEEERRAEVAALKSRIRLLEADTRSTLTTSQRHGFVKG